MRKQSLGSASSPSSEAIADLRPPMSEDVRRAAPRILAVADRKAPSHERARLFKSDTVPADTARWREFMDVPIGRAAGVSPRRERLWGLAGGVIGSLVGVGALLVTLLVQDIRFRELWGSPYPPLFTRRSMIPLDYYFLGLVALGLLFLEGGVVALRFSKYPRTDGMGAALLGTVLCALGGVVLFLRLWAVLHG
jgi:hypothetical protein